MIDWLLLSFVSENPNLDFDKTIVTHSPLAVISTIDPVEVPYKSDQKIEPIFLQDKELAVWAQDFKSGKKLIAQNEYRAQPMASLTKIMTYLVIKEHHDLDEVVTVSQEATKAEGVKINLFAGEALTVKTMLEAILIPSANDAAMALAIWDAGSEEAFVEKMNQKAQRLGLTSAKFYNSSGLDLWRKGNTCEDEAVPELCKKVEPGAYGNVISAKDAAQMAKIALRDDFFRATVQKGEFKGTSIDGQFTHEKPTTNQLYGTFVNSRGVKTGYTHLARQCFINLSIVDGHEVLTVVLGSSDRFGETKRLIDWIKGSFQWR